MKEIITGVILFWCVGLNAQDDYKDFKFSFPIYQFKMPALSPAPQPQPSPQPSSYIYRQYANPHPGFFCKMEYKIETRSKLAPRFRLGSLNYTNWMEGKGEWYTRYRK